MRLFIGIDLPKSLKEELSRLTAKLKKCDCDTKWVQVQNLHLSFKFLGEVNEEKIKNIEEIISTSGKQHKTLELNLEKFGFFPNEKYPGVFFVATDTEEKLKRIYSFLEDNLQTLGFKKEERFKSHITLARFRSSKNIEVFKKQLESIAVKGKFPVNEITLFRSILKPQGPIYEKLFSASFKQ
ncbi:MAG: RNA 2',3'-cyclic phosphodiesterase [Candidatus Omnitrophota bacterium]|jgi:2'-5' RNA ligase